LSNAIKFSPDNGAIFIHLQKIENELVLDIRDEGPGVEREDQARIFDAFYQGRPPEKGLIQGSGLGLSIVKEFVEVHNGEITLLTESSGKGAHLRMTFPMANAEKELAWAV
ncbi:MAG TPA: ATP-binding protein, partial [Gammaproteobacteria bacterium]|nr:ATP-binding protein [Gammaproteobacteria bacterium]